MPFLAPVIASVLALDAIGTAIVSVGLSIGLGYLSRSLAPDPKQQRAGSGRATGARLSLRVESNADREFLFGRTATAGSLVYWKTYGPNGNDYLQMVYALTDHECTSLEKISIDGNPYTLGAVTTTAWASGQTVTAFPDCMWIEFHAGAWDQAADADLVAQGGGAWTANDRGRGVCYVRVTMKYDAAKFPNGVPRFTFEIKGGKFYDFRKDSSNGGSGAHRWGSPATYEWSDNPVVVEYNFRRGIAVNGNRLCGMATSLAAMPFDIWTAAANICDESVALKAGGVEKRYRASGIIPVNAESRSVIHGLITAYAGIEADAGGIIRPLPGAARAPVSPVISDGDIMAPDQVEMSPKVARTALFNAAFGTFSDPAHGYEIIGLPPRISPSDEAADGGVHLPETYALDFVTSAPQGQRVLEIYRRRERYQRRASMRLRSRFAVLEPGDWVSWTSARYGLEGALFEVQRVTLQADLTVTVELREISAAIYSWAPATDELDPQSPAALGSGGPSFTGLASFAVEAVTITAAAGVSRPGIHAIWTAVTDRTVTEIVIEYRRPGDAVALERRVIDPGAGQYTWVDGVQGGSVYEVRARPVTQPVRATA